MNTKLIHKDIAINFQVYKNNQMIVTGLSFGNFEAIKSDKVYLFVELVNSFVLNRLNIESLYEIGSCKIRIKSKKKQKILVIEVIERVLSQEENKYEDKFKKYEFEKYECSFIVRMLNKILNRATFKELL